MINIVRNSNKYHYLVNLYQINNVADIANLPTVDIHPGSEAYVLDDGTTYILNNDYEWVLKKNNGGGESSECLIGIDFVTDIQVGHLPSGTVIHKEDKISDILYKILCNQEPMEKKNIYIGSVENLPDNINSLELKEIEIVELQRGANIMLPPAVNSYRVIACTNDLTLAEWKEVQTGWPISYGTKILDGYNLYYINEPDEAHGDDGRLYDEGQAGYQFTFKEV